MKKKQIAFLTFFDQVIDAYGIIKTRWDMPMC